MILSQYEMLCENNVKIDEIKVMFNVSHTDYTKVSDFIRKGVGSHGYPLTISKYAEYRIYTSCTSVSPFAFSDRWIGIDTDSILGEIERLISFGFTIDGFRHDSCDGFLSVCIALFPPK